MCAAVALTLVEWQTALYLPDRWEEAFIEGKEAARQGGAAIVEVLELPRHVEPHL